MKNPYLPQPYKVLEVYRETSDNFTVTINMKIKHDAGQFVQVSAPGIGECPISICSDSEKHLKLNIKNTQLAAALKPKKKVETAISKTKKKGAAKTAEPKKKLTRLRDDAGLSTKSALREKPSMQEEEAPKKKAHETY